MSFARAFVSGLLRFQSVSSRVRSAVLDLAQVVVEPPLRLAGEDPADLIPLALDAVRSAPRLDDVGLVGDGACLVEERALGVDLLA